jgi:hypothetical protein
LRALDVNFAITHQAEDPHRFWLVGENKQLLIAILSLQNINLLAINSKDEREE